MTQVLTAGGGGSLIILLIVMAGLMYFTAYRPAKKQKEESEKRRSEMEVGDYIITIGGVFGKVVEKNELTFTIETPDKSQIEFLSQALSSIVEDDQYLESRYKEEGLDENVELDENEEAVREEIE